MVPHDMAISVPEDCLITASTAAESEIVCGLPIRSCEDYSVFCRLRTVEYH